jgi:hypothetical protein
MIAIVHPFEFYFCLVAIFILSNCVISTKVSGGADALLSAFVLVKRKVQTKASLRFQDVGVIDAQTILAVEWIVLHRQIMLSALNRRCLPASLS